MKRIIVTLFVSFSMVVSAPAKADGYLALIDLAYGLGKVVVLGATAGAMYVGGAAVKAVTPAEKTEKIAEAPVKADASATEEIKTESLERTL